MEEALGFGENTQQFQRKASDPTEITLQFCEKNLLEEKILRGGDVLEEQKVTFEGKKEEATEGEGYVVKRDEEEWGKQSFKGVDPWLFLTY